MLRLILLSTAFTLLSSVSHATLIKTRPEDQRVMLHQANVTVTCEVTADWKNGSDELTWSIEKNDKEFWVWRSSDGRFLDGTWDGHGRREVRGMFNLFIKDVYPEDIGKYHCDLYSGGLITRSSARLSLGNCPQTVMHHGGNAEYPEKQYVSLFCGANMAGMPSGAYTWYKNGTFVGTGPYYRFTASLSDSGTYTCKVNRKYRGVDCPAGLPDLSITTTVVVTPTSGATVFGIHPFSIGVTTSLLIHQVYNIFL